MSLGPPYDDVLCTEPYRSDRTMLVVCPSCCCHVIFGMRSVVAPSCFSRNRDRDPRHLNGAAIPSGTFFFVSPSCIVSCMIITVLFMVVALLTSLPSLASMARHLPFVVWFFFTLSDKIWGWYSFVVLFLLCHAGVCGGRFCTVCLPFCFFFGGCWSSSCFVAMIWGNHCFPSALSCLLLDGIIVLMN